MVRQICLHKTSVRFIDKHFNKYDIVCDGCEAIIGEYNQKTDKTIWNDKKIKGVEIIPIDDSLR